MDDLFSASTRERSFQNAPLAVRMRPNSLDEYVGQQKAVGKGSWLRAAIEHDVLSSVILYGPAGTGKTTLAHIIANHTKSEFVEVSAVTGTVKDLRRVIDEAKTRLNTYDRRTILFIDEIHRFSKSQQDALLHAVENRTVIMIGATTENPYFEVNSALLSRGRVVELEHLKDEDIATLIERALEAPQGLNGKFSADEDTVKTICTLAAGDARSALTTLELASEIAVTRPDTEGTPAPAAGERYPITVDDVKIANPRRGFSYDKNGDMHYDIISAFIKSMRGSDPGSTIYWLARMIDAGEDPKFIARRIMIQASEDVGNADPQALLVAHAAFKSAEPASVLSPRVLLFMVLSRISCPFAAAPFFSWFNVAEPALRKLTMTECFPAYASILFASSFNRYPSDSKFSYEIRFIFLTFLSPVCTKMVEYIPMRMLSGLHASLG